MSAACRCEPDVHTIEGDGATTTTYRHKQVPPPSRTDQPQRWEPDVEMVAAVLSHPRAPRPMRDLSPADRCWLVDGLTRAGQTAEEIAERMSCSRRLVMTLRAEPFTQLCGHYHRDLGQAETDQRALLVDLGLVRGERDEARKVVTRLSRQRDEMLGQLQTKGRIDTLPCGHPRAKWNMYEYVDKSGRSPRSRVGCRECARDRSSDYRARRKTADQGQSVTPQCDEILHDRPIASDP